MSLVFIFFIANAQDARSSSLFLLSALPFHKHSHAHFHLHSHHQNQSACQGTIAAVNGTNVCAANDGDDDSYSGMDTLPCFPALTRFGNRCCSLEHLPFSTVGNLNSLELGATGGCNSLTAPFLAEALCKNQNSCEFDVDENTTLNVTVSKIPKYGVGATDLSAICKNANYLTTGYCQSSFGHNMDDSSCVTGGLYSSASTGAVVKADYRLMFEAVCQVGGGMGGLLVCGFVLGLRWYFSLLYPSHPSCSYAPAFYHIKTFI